jgi:Tol biopolymer transport system component
MRERVSAYSLSVLFLLNAVLVSAVFSQTALRRNGKIAFTSDRDGNPEIYVMNPDGTNQVRLTNNTILDDHPTWSPDGRRIAFLSQRPSRQFAIFLMSADGTGKSEIVSVNYQPPTNLGWDYWSVSWSPDGRQIAFQDQSTSGQRSIYIVNADGSNRRFLTNGIQPAWSDDGSKLIFSNQVVPFYFWLFTIRPDGTNLQPLPTAQDYLDTAPAWSPDGEKIVFQGWDWANWEDLIIANADGTNRQIFDQGCDSSTICGGLNFPDWSPDGNQIVYCRDGYGYDIDPEIWANNVIGFHRRQLTNSGGNNVNPSWQPLPRTFADFDGDSRSDVSVFRPSDNTWYIDRSTQGFTAARFGLASDVLTPGDYDGDGKTDIAIFRDGTWWMIRSSNATIAAFQFGQTGDTPVAADFTGDGQNELAVFRNGEWWSLDLSTNQSAVFNWGAATDKLVTGDYDGDGRTDPAVYRDGVWYLLRSSLGPAAGPFGLPTDTPIPADYDGDAKTDLAVFREGVWYVMQSRDGFTAFTWGIGTDTPVPADYDGDGKTDAAIFRNGEWWMRQSTGSVSVHNFGSGNDRPIPGAFYARQPVARDGAH